MQTVTALVPRDPATCWRAFVDASQLTAWVPGLRRAQVLSKARGLPEEVHYEFADALAYTLVYTYDRDNLEVRWEPKLGRSAGVTGFARLEAVDAGTQLTYGLAHGDSRTPDEQALGDLQRLVDAFVAWVTGDTTR
ncbi:MAG: SRPBCC family protein [Deltaproteobacteria bacterium]|nr:SRPBCC family protein [Deltaproteobacteria bacterium]